MNMRLVQLGTLIITPYNSVKTEAVEEDTGIVESTIIDGGVIISAKRRVVSREIVVEGSYIDQQNPQFTPHKKGKVYNKSDYLKALKRTQQKLLTAYFVGEDNRIYETQVKTGIFQVTDEGIDSFDFTYVLNAPHPYFTDIGSCLFYQEYLEQKLKTKVWRYNNILGYHKYQCQPYTLVYIEIPSAFYTQWYATIETITEIINSTSTVPDDTELIPVTTTTPVTQTVSTPYLLNDGASGQYINDGNTGYKLNATTTTTTATTSTVYITGATELLLDDGDSGLYLDDGTTDGAILGSGIRKATYILDDGTAGLYLDDGTQDGAYLNGGATEQTNTVVNVSTTIINRYLIPITVPFTTIRNSSGRMRIDIIAYFGTKAPENTISIDNYSFKLTKQYFVLNTDGAFEGNSLYSLQRLKAIDNVFSDDLVVIYNTPSYVNIYYTKMNVIV